MKESNENNKNNLDYFNISDIRKKINEVLSDNEYLLFALTELLKWNLDYLDVIDEKNHTIVALSIIDSGLDGKMSLIYTLLADRKFKNLSKEVIKAILSNDSEKGALGIISGLDCFSKDALDQEVFIRLAENGYLIAVDQNIYLSAVNLSSMYKILEKNKYIKTTDIIKLIESQEDNSIDQDILGEYFLKSPFIFEYTNKLLHALPVYIEEDFAAIKNVLANKVLNFEDEKYNKLKKDIETKKNKFFEDYTHFNVDWIKDYIPKSENSYIDSKNRILNSNIINDFNNKEVSEAYDLLRVVIISIKNNEGIILSNVLKGMSVSFYNIFAEILLVAGFGDFLVENISSFRGLSKDLFEELLNNNIELVLLDTYFNEGIFKPFVISEALLYKIISNKKCTQHLIISLFGMGKVIFDDLAYEMIILNYDFDPFAILNLMHYKQEEVDISLLTLFFEKYGDQLHFDTDGTIKLSSQVKNFQLMRGLDYGIEELCFELFTELTDVYWDILIDKYVRN